jgi:hypothetical protein
MSKPSALTGIVLALLAMGWLNLHWLERPLDLSPIISDKPASVASLDGASHAPDGALPGLRDGMAEALLRPLFHTSRRPFTPPPVEIVAAPAEAEAPPPEPFSEPVPTADLSSRPELSLSGISLSGTARRALLGAAGGNDIRWYAQGDTIAGWVVAAISKEAVTLASGERRLTLSLYPLSEGAAQ